MGDVLEMGAAPVVKLEELGRLTRVFVRHVGDQVVDPPDYLGQPAIYLTDEGWSRIKGWLERRGLERCLIPAARGDGGGYLVDHTGEGAPLPWYLLGWLKTDRGPARLLIVDQDEAYLVVEALLPLLDREHVPTGLMGMAQDHLRQVGELRIRIGKVAGQVSRLAGEVEIARGMDPRRLAGALRLVARGLHRIAAPRKVDAPIEVS